MKACFKVAVFAAPFALAASASADVMSTFDTDADGWTLFNDASQLEWIDTGGNPGGYLTATDNVSGDVWYWNAPSKYLGNQAGAFGMTLSWDARQSSTTSQFSSNDLVLVATDGTNLTLASDPSRRPGTEWTSISVVFDSSEDWFIDGAAATDSDIQMVLSDLAALRIRGEFRTGADTGDLDNVLLVPTPGSVALLPLAMMGLACRRRA